MGKDWNHENRSKSIDYAAKWRRRNPIKRNIPSAEWRARNPEKLRAQYDRRNERRRADRVAQAQRPRPDCCELCGSTEKLHYDHCHVSERFRGWLCSRCNRVLGFAGDDVDLLMKMADYLRQHDAQPQIRPLAKNQKDEDVPALLALLSRTSTS
jgi:hypothetical protein